MANREYGQLAGINQKLASVIECVCDGNGCKGDCALKVTLTNQPPVIDIEYVCDGDTNTWHKITHVTPINADGTAGTTAEMSVDTGIACDEPKPDYEPVSVCRNNTIHLVTYVYEEDGTQTEASAIDTAIPCNTSRDVDVLINCDGTTKTITVEGTNPTQVVFDEEQVLKVSIDKSCDIAPTSRDVDINTDCLGTTETVAVKDEFATEVVLKPNQNIEVTIDKSCDTTRDVDMLNNCDGTTEVIAVKDEAPTEVILNENQVLKVAIDKSCDVPVADRNIDVVDDCAGAVTSTAVSGDVAKEVILGGSTKTIDVRLKEDCTTDPVKTITTNIDCAGTTANVDTTKTVEAVINQVVDTKQCSKDESLSEIEVCASGVTLVKKTKLESDGTETETFYGANGVIVPTPATYDIGVCAVPLTQVVQTQDDCAGATSDTTVNSTVAIAGSMKTLNVRIIEDCVPNFDTEYFAGCSSVDGRKIFRKVVKNEETGVETITLVEQDGVTLVTDASTLEACSGADYETASFCRYDEVNDVYYKKTVFINSSDITDTFEIWMDVDGNIVPPVAVTVDCTTECTTDMEYERCFETGAGVVTVQGYFIKSATFIETYQTAKVIASTDPAYSVGDDVLASVDSWDQVSCLKSCETIEYHSLVGTNGVIARRWTGADSVSPGTSPAENAFTSIDSEGYPDHVNIPTSTIIETSFDLITTEVGNSTQSIFESWVYLPQSGYIRDNDVTGDEGFVYISGADGNMVDSGIPWITNNWNNSQGIPISAGLYRIRAYIHDQAGTNSGFDLEFSTDNLSFANIPSEHLFISKPVQSCEHGKLCDGEYFELDGVTPLVFDHNTQICDYVLDNEGLVSGACTENDLSLTVTSGTGNIPAGFKSVTINNISGITTINGGYELGDGRRDNSISFGTNRGNCVNEILPAYTLAGGTWQWIGHL